MHGLLSSPLKNSSSALCFGIAWLSLDGLEVFLGTLRIRLHRRRTRGPARRADFIRVVLHALRFVDGAAKRSVVDGAVLNDAFAIDDVQTTERGAVFVKDVVSLGDFALKVAHERVRQVAET